MDALIDALSDLPGIRTEAKQFTLDERLTDEAPNALVVTANGTEAAAELEHELAAGTPHILCSRIDERLVFAVETIEPEEDGVVARRIRELPRHGRDRTAGIRAVMARLPRGGEGPAQAPSAARKPAISTT